MFPGTVTGQTVYERTGSLSLGAGVSVARYGAARLLRDVFSQDGENFAATTEPTNEEDSHTESQDDQASKAKHE